MSGLGDISARGDQARYRDIPPTIVGDVGTITESALCIECDAPFMSMSLAVGGKPWGFKTQRCQVCMDRQEAAQQAKEKDAAARSSPFLTVCPPEYQDCDFARVVRRLGSRKARRKLPDGTEQQLEPSEAVALIAEWDARKRGLALIGPAELCKTRLMFAALRKSIEAGASFLLLNGAEFSSQFAASYEKGAGAAREWLERVRSREILFLDDIDKARWSEGTITALWNITEHRHAQRMTLCFTSNADGATFAERLRAEARKAQLEDTISQAILRRLRALADSFTL